MPGKDKGRKDIVRNPVQGFLRSADFWRRALGVYLGYKGAQARAFARGRAGWSTERIETKLWQPHHEWAGDELYKLAVDLRGFYLKVCCLLALAY